MLLRRIGKAFGGDNNEGVGKNEGEGGGRRVFAGSSFQSTNSKCRLDPKANLSH